MFVLLKPEMRRCIESLDSYLDIAGFKIVSRHPIDNWKETAKEIYAPQVLDPKFSSEFNVYLWMTNNLFGNSAIAYQLSENGNLKEDLRELMKLKLRFREDISKKLDDPINFMVNLDKLSTYQPSKIGKQGIINIDDTPLSEGNFKGRWDYFFFKYIHTSDTIEAHNREENVLRNKGIYKNRIKDKEWAQMIETGTLTLPKSRGVYYNE